MANRKLLEENTVSKFMKLAKIDSSRSKRFLTEMYGYEEESKKPSEEEEGYYEEEEGGYGTMSLDELDLDKYLGEAEEEEEKKESGEGDEMGELSMTSEEAKDIVSALEKLLDKLKTAVEAGPEEEETPEGPEETEPSSGEGEGEAPEAGGMEAGGMEPAGGAAPEELKEALVNRVARRVAARLLRESKKRR